MKRHKVLLFDVETAPIQAYVWQLWETNVIKVVKDWYMLSYAYKWYGESTIHVVGLPDFSVWKKDKSDDEMLIRSLWELFNEADLIIGHNSNNFDIKKANTRFLIHGLKPPSPYHTVDTLKEFRKYMGFSSNKLNELSRQLAGEEKERTGGADLWFDCMQGDMNAWARMKKYNKKDVVLLENRYKDILPFITNHPNLSLLDNKKDNCPNCGSKALQNRGWGVNRKSKYEKLHCTHCGAWFKGANIKV